VRRLSAARHAAAVIAITISGRRDRRWERAGVDGGVDMRRTVPDLQRK